MRIAKHLGLDVAAVETTEIAGRKLIVVERYDRVVSADGSVERIHQEDFCQATGTPPDTKYEEDGGPSLRRVADILQSWPRPTHWKGCAGGNPECPARQRGCPWQELSLLHHASGGLTLAPLYDLMCTLHYEDDRLAMYVDGVRRTDRVTAQRMVNEVVRWGVSPAGRRDSRRPSGAGPRRMPRLAKKRRASPAI